MPALRRVVARTLPAVQRRKNTSQNKNEPRFAETTSPPPQVQLAQLLDADAALKFLYAPPTTPERAPPKDPRPRLAIRVLSRSAGGAETTRRRLRDDACAARSGPEHAWRHIEVVRRRRSLDPSTQTRAAAVAKTLKAAAPDARVELWREGRASEHAQERFEAAGLSSRARVDLRISPRDGRELRDFDGTVKSTSSAISTGRSRARAPRFRRDGHEREHEESASRLISAQASWS